MRKRVTFAAVALGLAALLAVLWANLRDQGPGERYDSERPDVPVPLERRARPPAEDVVSTTVLKSDAPVPETEEAKRGGLRVLVLDANESPIAGARVRIYAHREGKQGTTESFETDTSGEVRESDLLPGWINVHLYVGTYSLSEDTTIRAGENAEVRIVLPATVVVEGTVRHVDKGLLGRISVRFERRSAGAEVGLATTTDATGRFRFEEVPPGTYDVALTGAEIGYRPRPRARLKVELPGPVENEFLLGIVRLRGRVVDPADEPVGAVSVTLYRSGFYLEASTDSSGEFVFRDVPPGTYSLTLSRDGFGVESQQIEVGEEVLDLAFALKHAARVRFRFTDTEGDPIAGQHSVFLRGNNTSRGPTVTAVEQGYARYDKLVPGSYSIRVKTAGYAEFKSIVEIRPGDNEVPVVLTPLADPGEPVLTGTVRDAQTGDPLPGARVNVQAYKHHTAVTDDKGVFRLRNFETCKVKMWIRKKGYGLELFREIQITGGKNLKRDFPLRPAGTIHFILTDKNGKPIVGRCTLVLSPVTEGGTNVGTGVTADEEGHATFHHILPGEYRLSVHKDGTKSERVETTVHLGEQTLRLRLE